MGLITYLYRSEITQLLSTGRTSKYLYLLLTRRDQPCFQHSLYLVEIPFKTSTDPPQDQTHEHFKLGEQNYLNIISTGGNLPGFHETPTSESWAKKKHFDHLSGFYSGEIPLQIIMGIKGAQPPQCHRPQGNKGLLIVLN